MKEPKLLPAGGVSPDRRLQASKRRMVRQARQKNTKTPPEDRTPQHSIPAMFGVLGGGRTSTTTVGVQRAGCAAGRELRRSAHLPRVSIEAGRLLTELVTIANRQSSV